VSDFDLPIQDLGPKRHRRAVWALVNAQRRDHGLRPVRFSINLSLSARRWCRWMVRHSKFTHGDEERRLQHSPYARLARRRGLRFKIGEVLGFGLAERSTPRSIVAAWMASPKHRAVVLGEDFRHGSVWSVADAPQPGKQADGVTVVHHFGWRRK
jgi:uncharacterized protein YkwD